MYYVVPHGQPLDVTNHASYSTIVEARDKADAMYAKTGNHQHVILVSTRWTTQTIGGMAELLAQGGL